MSHKIMEANADPKEWPATMLKFKGVFDYNKLSTMIINWLRNQNFRFTEGVHNHKMSCPHGFEIEREIYAEKKIDDYYQHNITILIHMWDAFEVDAVKDGKKVKLWNARIEIRMGYAVVLDYADKWGKTAFLEKLRRFYDEYIIKREIIIKQGDPLYYKVLGFHTTLKKFFEIEGA
jgi:hypothetical protein